MIRISRAWESVLLTGMLVAFLVNFVLLLSQKGLFIDDSMHMPAGYSYLLTHDYRLNQEHPPLVKLLSGLGLWRVHPSFPFDSPGWQQAATPEDPQDGMTRIEEAFFDRNAQQFEQIAFYGRLPMLIIPLLLLFAIWWFTRQLFGPVAALVAVLLAGTEPNIIGNSIVVQNDVASALALLVFVMAVKFFVTDGTAPAARALVLGGALGVALVTKYSLVILAPVSVVIVIVWATTQLIRKKSTALQVLFSLAVVFAIAWVILIAFYAFHVDRIDADESSKVAGWFYLTGSATAALRRFLMWLPPLLPRYFVYGIDMVVSDSRQGRPAFLLGAVSAKGWWYYFPVAFVLKTTIPFLLSSVCGLVLALVNVFRSKRYVLLYVVLPGVLYLALAMTSHLNIGVRHALPVFPFAAILGAGFVCAVVEFVLERSGLKQRRVLAVALAILALAPPLVIAVSTYPNYLTYFSPLAGGEKGRWEKLSDSNVETGQEVKTLALYLKAHGENRVTGIMVGGEFLRFYGVELNDFPGWYDDSDDNSETDASDNDAAANDTAANDTASAADNSENNDAANSANHDIPNVTTNYVAIGAWYLSEIDLTDKQKQFIDFYRHQQPEAMVGNSIFLFRRSNSEHPHADPLH